MFAGALCLCGLTVIVERIETRKSQVWYGFLHQSMQRLLEGDSLLGMKLQMIFLIIFFLVFGFLKINTSLLPKGGAIVKK